MRTLRVLVCILTVISVALTVLLWFRGMKMNEKPVIVCSVDGDIEAECKVTDEELLKFVSATDGHDGDISDKIIVERKNYFISNGITSINYVVCDSDNNVTKLEKHLRFTDYHPPRFTLKSDLISYVKSAMDFSGVIGAEDVYDGNISDRVKIISSTYNSAYAGEYQIDCKVTNSFGDTSEMIFNAIVLDNNSESGKIKLNSYILYVKKGEQPDFEANIARINGNAENDVKIKTDEFNKDVPGTYSVYYQVNDRIQTRVLVVVEDN